MQMDVNKETVSVRALFLWFISFLRTNERIGMLLHEILLRFFRRFETDEW